MLKSLNMSRIMKEAHRRTREFVEEYGVDYQVQLGLFISYLIEEELNNKEIDLNEWFEDYKTNSLYNYILYKNNILSKNGWETTSQVEEAKTTSTFYQILPSEREDIEQLALLKVIEHFEKKGKIQRKHRFSVWALACLNAVKQHMRNLKRFSSYTDHRYNQIGWVGDAATPTTYGGYDGVDIRLDLKSTLSPRQFEIAQLIGQGYNKSEISEILGISRQAVHKNIRSIKERIIEAGLVSL